MKNRDVDIILDEFARQIKEDPVVYSAVAQALTSGSWLDIELRLSRTRNDVRPVEVLIRVRGTPP